MTCEELWRELAAWLDNEGAAAWRLAVQGHLQLCSPCHRLVKTCHATMLLYREEHAPELPDPVHERLMARVREGDAPSA